MYYGDLSPIVICGGGGEHILQRTCSRPRYRGIVLGRGGVTLQCFCSSFGVGDGFLFRGWVVPDMCGSNIGVVWVLFWLAPSWQDLPCLRSLLGLRQCRVRLWWFYGLSWCTSCGIFSSRDHFRRRCLFRCNMRLSKRKRHDWIKAIHSQSYLRFSQEI